MRRLTRKLENGRYAQNYTTGDGFFVGMTEMMQKLGKMEDLEEAVVKHFPNATLEELVNITLKHIQGKDEEIRIGRILTNEDAEKWERWKNLEEAGRLMVLPEPLNKDKLLVVIAQTTCPNCFGLPDWIGTEQCYEHDNCQACWIEALKGGE